MASEPKFKLTEELFIAAAHGDIKRLEELLACGTNAHCRTSSLGDNALLKSSLYHGEEEVISLLLNQGLDCPEYRKDIDLLNALKDYKKTKEIPEVLLPCFNQKGDYHSFSLWSGKQVNVGQLIFEKIPKERIQYRDKNGNLHLKTSYDDSSTPFRKENQKARGYHTPKASGQPQAQLQEKLALEYFSIAGSLFVGYCDHLVTPNLAYIGGDLVLAGGIKSTQGPNLEEIAGGLQLPTKSKLHLPQLKRVGKDFWGDGLNISGNPKVELPKLEKVIGNVRLPHTTQCFLPNLQYIGGDLELPEIEIKAIKKEGRTHRHNPLHKLKQVFGTINTHPKLLKMIIKSLPETHLKNWMIRNAYELGKNHPRLLQKIKDEIAIRSFTRSHQTKELYLD